MDLIEEMWISKPQRRITKLSDLSDGVIARIKSVSYTHLDVYKRQVYTIVDYKDNTPEINSVFCKSSNSRKMFLFEDVYKRQQSD